MEIFYGLIVLGLAGLFAPFCGKLAGYETHRKPFDLVGVGGMFFLLSAAFQLAIPMMAPIAAICHGLMIAAFIIGWIGLLCGTFWATSEVLREPDHGMVSTTRAEAR
jgi:hypothetical protein